MKPERRNGQMPYAGTQAVCRALSLLHYFTDERPFRTLSELTRASGLNKTTTFRLLTALESEGLLARNPEGDTYRLGPQIVVLGGIALRSNDIRSVSRPELKLLAESEGETATLEILAGPDILIIDEVAGAHLMSGGNSIGTRWPAFATSTGKAILANLPESQAFQIINGPLPRITPRTITNRNAIRRELIRVRRNGYAIADEELEAGYVAVGAAVRNHDGEPVAALCIGGPTIRIPSRRIPEIGRAVADSAARVSERLGFVGQ